VFCNITKRFSSLVMLHQNNLVPLLTIFANKFRAYPSVPLNNKASCLRLKDKHCSLVSCSVKDEKRSMTLRIGVNVIDLSFSSSVMLCQNKLICLLIIFADRSRAYPSVLLNNHAHCWAKKQTL
jgi:hypothetical protein